MSYRYVSPYFEIKCEDLWPCGITRRWLMLPWVASTLLLSAKCLKSQLSKAWQGCQALRFSAWVLLREKEVFSRHSFRKCVTRWVVTCWLLTLLPWSACGQTGEFYAQFWARAAPTPGVMLTSVGVWSLWKAGLLAVDSSSHEVPTCSRLGCWLISRVALGERVCLREEKKKSFLRHSGERSKSVWTYQLSPYGL